MPKSPTCVFCGKSLQGQKGKEHIFPRWLQQHLGLKNQQLFNALYAASGEISSVHKHTFHGHVSGLVCDHCNSGWLSELEVQAKPLLIPLLDGIFTGQINWRDCQIIAFWVFKTCLTLHSASQVDKFIPAEHYKAVYERSAIPKGVVVAISNFQGKNDLYWIQNQNWQGKIEGISIEKLKADFKQTYRITLCAGHLAARVHYWPLDQWCLFDYAESSVKYVCRVKPKGVSWPPEDPITNVRELDESLFIIESQGCLK